MPHNAHSTHGDAFSAEPANRLNLRLRAPPTACTKNNATARAAEGATRDPGRAPVPKSSRPDASTDEQLSEMTGRYVNGPPVIGAEASFAQRGTEPDGSHLRLLLEETHGGDHPASRFNTRATCIACQ